MPFSNQTLNKAVNTKKQTITVQYKSNHRIHSVLLTTKKNVTWERNRLPSETLVILERHKLSHLSFMWTAVLVYIIFECDNIVSNAGSYKPIDESYKQEAGRKLPLSYSVTPLSCHVATSLNKQTSSKYFIEAVIIPKSYELLICINMIY